MKDFAQQKKDIKKNKSVSNITSGKSPVPIKLILALMVFPVVFLMGLDYSLIQSLKFTQ